MVRSRDMRKVYTIHYRLNAHITNVAWPARADTAAAL